MKFDDVFKTIYDDIIFPICNKKKMQVGTALDVNKPGFILEDIIRSIEESEVLIADITPIPHNGCRQPKRRRV